MRAVFLRQQNATEFDETICRRVSTVLSRLHLGRTFWHFHSPHFTSPRLVPPFLWIDLRNLFIAKNADMALLKTTLATRLCCSPVLCHWQAIARC